MTGNTNSSRPLERRKREKGVASRGRSCVKLTEESASVDKKEGEKEGRTVFPFQPFFPECDNGGGAFRRA